MRDKAQATVETKNPFIILVSTDFDLLGAQVNGGFAEGLDQGRTYAMTAQRLGHHQAADFGPLAPAYELCVGDGVSTAFSHQMGSLPPFYKAERAQYVIGYRLGSLFGEAIALQIPGISKGQATNGYLAVSFSAVQRLLVNETLIPRILLRCLQ